MKHRKDTVEDDDEPLFSETRVVQQDGDSLAVNIMSEFRKMRGIEKGEEVKVEAYKDRYVVREIEE